MSQVIISGNVSGSCTLTAPDVAGASVLTLPVATETLVGKATTDVLTNKTLGAGLVAGASILTSGTAVASTSGTSIDFTGIPSWAKRVTVMFNGVSTNGVSNFLIQLGNGSIVSTGYSSAATYASVINSSTAGMIISSAGLSSTEPYNSVINIINISGNSWVESGILIGNSTQLASTSGGSKTLSGTLDRVRITTVNGTDTFDAGSINILYE
jgi:hypothetical protein